MSERVQRLFQRLDEDVRDRMSFVHASQEETLQLMLGLVKRAVVMGLANVHADASVDRVAAQVVDMILEMRDEVLGERKLS